MKELLKNRVFDGDLPNIVVIALCGACFFGGRATVQQVRPYPIVVAEKGAVILQAALDRQGESHAQLQAAIDKPIISVLKKYQNEGYLVLDISRNDEGDMVVAEVPPGVKDITQEMRNAIGPAPKQQNGASATAPAAAAHD